MRNTTRIKRLEMLSDMLKRHKEIFPETKFNINLWLGETTETIRGKEWCGTAACALGSAACYPPFKKMGLRISGSSVEGDTTPKYKDYYDTQAGAAFFGISLDESDHLFYGSRYDMKFGDSRVTAKMVAKRVDQLVKQYKKLDTTKRAA